MFLISMKRYTFLKAEVLFCYIKKVVLLKKTTLNTLTKFKSADEENTNETLGFCILSNIDLEQQCQKQDVSSEATERAPTSP